jgi:hypothetical protein
MCGKGECKLALGWCVREAGFEGSVVKDVCPGRLTDQIEPGDPGTEKRTEDMFEQLMGGEWVMVHSMHASNNVVQHIVGEVRVERELLAELHAISFQLLGLADEGDRAIMWM